MFNLPHCIRPYKSPVEQHWVTIKTGLTAMATETKELLFNSIHWLPSWLHMLENCGCLYFLENTFMCCLAVASQVTIIGIFLNIIKNVLHGHLVTKISFNFNGFKVQDGGARFDVIVYHRFWGLESTCGMLGPILCEKFNHWRWQEASNSTEYLYVDLKHIMHIHDLGFPVKPAKMP